MRRRVIIVFLALALSFFAGLWIAGRDTIISAQQVTPASWTSIGGPFPFCYQYVKADEASTAIPTIGCSLAEDKRSDPYVKGYKMDVDRNHADCLRWSVVGAVGAIPAAQLSMDPACSGGTRLGTGIYWFDAPPIATPTLMPTATGFLVSPSPSPSASVSATLTPTPTPSPFPISKTSTPTATPTHLIITITPTPMFPALPSCTTQILIYWTGDPAEGGLGGKVGSVTWCGSCNSGCGLWMFGVDKATLDGWTEDANRRVKELWATVTVEAQR